MFHNFLIFLRTGRFYLFSRIESTQWVEFKNTIVFHFLLFGGGIFPFRIFGISPRVIILDPRNFGFLVLISYISD